MSIQTVQGLQTTHMSSKVEGYSSPSITPKLTRKTSTCATQDQIATKSLLQGSANHIFSIFNGNSKGNAPHIQLLSLAQGSILRIDGATTMDGTATIKKLNKDELELQFEINIPGLVRGVAGEHFNLKNGKANLSLKLTKNGDEFSYQLTDNHAGKRKGSGDTDLSISNSSFKRSDLFGYNARTVKKQTVSIPVSEGTIKITIEDDPKGNVSGSILLPMLPSLVNTFSFTKQS